MTAVEYCRRILTELVQAADLPDMSVDNRAVLYLHQIQVQDALHELEVSE